VTYHKHVPVTLTGLWMLASLWHCHSTTEISYPPGGYSSTEGAPSLRVQRWLAEPHTAVHNEPGPDAGKKPGKGLCSKLATLLIGLWR